MLSCLGDNLAVPHNLDPLSDDILATVRGHLDVHSSAVAFEVGWHFGVSIAIPNAADFGLAGVYCSGELVDAASCLNEALVGKGGAALYGRDEAICDGVHGVGEVVVLHAEDGLSQPRGYQRVMPDTVGADAYLERGRGCNFLDGWSGGVWNILD